MLISRSGLIADGDKNVVKLVTHTYTVTINLSLSALEEFYKTSTPNS